VVLAAAGALALIVGVRHLLTQPGPAPRPVHRAGTVTGNCGRSPHVCGYPDSTNSGVPRGTALRSVPAQVSGGPGWRYDPRGWVQVFGHGAVLTRLKLHCGINITGSHVTISDDRIVATGRSFGISLRHAHAVTIERSDIYSRHAGRGRLMTGIKDIYGDSTGTRILANHIWHAATAIHLESGLVRGNYIHSPGYVHGDHVNGLSSNGGVKSALTVSHNTIFIDRRQTDAIGLFEDFGVQANRRITGNLLAGGGYTIYGGSKPGGPAPRNIQITGNQISRRFYPRGGYYGPVCRFPVTGRGNTWAHNDWSGTTSRIVATIVTSP
jgi:hypothetical protein